MLCSLEQLRRDDLQVGQHLGAAVTAAKHPGIGEVANDSPDAGVVPHLTRSCPVAELVQIGGNPLGTEALMHILIKNDPHNCGLGLVDNQLVDLVLALVEASASNKVIAIGCKAAFEAAVLDELAVVTAVGRHMARTPGISGKLFGALGKAGINIRFITQSPDELNIIFGVENKDFKRSIQVLYDKFAK